MKTKLKIVSIAAVLLLGFSCEHDLEKAIDKGIDCAAESIFESVKHTTDAANPKKINFTAEYSGTKTLKSVKWTFGDGTPSETITASGTTVSISHIYTTAGTYTVKADITIQNGSGTCTSSPTRTVTVN